MKKWLKVSLWVVFAVIIYILMSMVKNAQQGSVVEKPNIIIHVNGENAFLTENELYTRLKRKGFIYNNQIYKNLKVMFKYLY